ncbi:MAG TPA: glycosyltransferase 87 family protein [Candidatus Eremiobacteraceae bacterium]
MKSRMGIAVAFAAIAAAGAVAAGFAASKTIYFYDAFQHGNYLGGYRLPIHVVQQAAPGWNVVLTVWAMLAALACASVYFLRSLAGAGRRALRWLIGVQVGVAAVLSLFPIVQSGDMYAYVIYSRLYGHFGVNPYAITHPLTSADPVIGPILPFLSTMPFSDPYGPLWTILAGLLGRVESGASLLVAAWSFRAVAVASLVAATAAIAYSLRSLGPENASRRAGAFGLHPLALYESAVGAHNDVMMLAAGLWAFAVADELPLIAGLLAGAAIAIKVPALIALPFLLKRIARKHGVAWIAAGAVSLAVPWLCGRAFATPGGAGGNAALLGNAFSMSPDWLVNIPLFAAGVASGPAFAWLPQLPMFGTASWPRLVQVAVLAVFLVVAAISIVRYVLRPRIGEIWRTYTAFLWSISSMHPWYGLWVLPATASGGAWGVYAWWYGALLLGVYVLDGIAAPASLFWVPIAACVVFLAVPVIVVADRRRRRIA